MSAEELCHDVTMVFASALESSCVQSKFKFIGKQTDFENSMVLI